jgi:hypothetical protein
MVDTSSGSAYVLLAAVAGTNLVMGNVAASLGRDITEEEAIAIAQGLAAVPETTVQLDRVESATTTYHFDFESNSFE